MKIKDIIYPIKALTMEEVLKYLIEKSKKRDGKTFVVTVNTEIVMHARRDPEYEKILKSADLALVDGVGVLWAGKMFGKSFKGRVHGVDLVDKLSQAVSKQPITVGFLGGRENVAEETANRLVEKYPGLRVSFANSKFEIPQTDILFVALGSPKQEKWIAQNLDRLHVRVVIGVGGAFDFISGRVPRAPVWVRSLGLEWLFRLIIQPWRIKRQISLIHFVILVLKEKLTP